LEQVHNTITQQPPQITDKAGPKVSGAVTPAGKNVNSVTPLSPPVIFAASLMFIAASDEKIAEAENYLINKKFAGDKSSLEQGMDFYDKHSFADLLNLLPALSHPQKLCILANMIELSMVEDVFGSAQQEMLWNFAKASDIKEPEYTSLINIFIIKNKTSVLYENQGSKKR
jgi:hypothetical protein